jgi:transcription elongation factor Elf1
MTTIKACPLCGSEAKLKDSQGAQVRQGWVGCPKCQCYIQWKISPAGAIKKWNRRTEA